MHRFALALLLVTLLGAGLRAAKLGEPVRYDEAVTYRHFAQHGLDYALRHYTVPNNHILHTLLVRLSTERFERGPDPAAVLAATGVEAGGVSPHTLLLADDEVSAALREAHGDDAVTDEVIPAPLWALRLPALVAGVLVVPAAGWLGRRLHGDAAGLLAAGLAAASNVGVLYSVNARGYSLLTLATLTIFLAADRLREPERRTLAWGGFVAAGAVGAAAVPLMLFPTVAAAAWVALTARDRSWRLCGKLLVAGLATAAVTTNFYLPALLNDTGGLRPGAEGLRFFERLSPVGHFGWWGDFFRVLGHSWSLGLPGGGWGLAALLALAAVGSVRRPSPFVVTALVTLGLLAVLRMKLPDRGVCFALPLLHVAAAGGAATLAGLVVRRPRPRLALAAATLAGLGLAAVWWAADPLRRDEGSGSFPAARAVVADLRPRLLLGDRLAVDPYVAPQVEHELLRAGLSRRVLDPGGGGQIVHVLMRPREAYPPTLHGLPTPTYVMLWNGFDTKRRKLHARVPVETPGYEQARLLTLPEVETGD